MFLRILFYVEDVVQEVFIRLWEARLSLRDDTDLESFLFIVTRNLVFTRRRRSLDRSFGCLNHLNFFMFYELFERLMKSSGITYSCAACEGDCV